MSGTADPDRKMPSVAVFFGLVPSPSLSVDDARRLGDLLIDGVLIIPVVADARRFSTFVPPQIAGLNGISLEDCGADFERLAARILEGFGLLRERRRLFISYRRVETSGVAAQLYEALDASGFDVFLARMVSCGLVSHSRTFFGTAWPTRTWLSCSTLQAF
jgi:hypothetical protein